MGCGYSKLRGSKKRRGRLKVHKEDIDDNDDDEDVCSDGSDFDQQLDSAAPEKFRRLEQEVASSPPQQTARSHEGHIVNEEGLAGVRSHRIATKIKPISGPMRAQISASQLSFFRMLDEKIANGKDLDDLEDSSTTTIKSGRRNSIVRRPPPTDSTSRTAKSNGDVVRTNDNNSSTTDESGVEAAASSNRTSTTSNGQLQAS